jgi:hypothetical protein
MKSAGRAGRGAALFSAGLEKWFLAFPDRTMFPLGLGEEDVADLQEDADDPPRELR